MIKHPYLTGVQMQISGSEGFLLLIFSTGLIALSANLGNLDLMALRLFFIELLLFLGLILGPGHVVWNITGILYLLYLLWILVGLTYSTVPEYGSRVFLKYIYPFLIFTFSSKIFRNEDFLLKIILVIRKIGLAVIVIFFITPFILSFFPGVLWYSTALAIHFIFLSILSMALYYLRKKKSDLIFGIGFLIPCILWVFRTSILGSMVALSIFFFMKYKLRSLPYFVFVSAIFISIFLFFPSIKNKMFNKNIDSEQILQGERKIDKNDIDSNGRFAMWEWSLQNFYENNKLEGSGSGTLQAIFYKRKAEEGTVGIVHNDYVQILCDNGLIGLILYLSVFLTMLIHTFFVYQNKFNSEIIRLAAITAGASAIGMAVTSFTDNTVNYSMATLSYPFGFYGIMLGLLKAQKSQYIQNHTGIVIQ
jgi:O-antigen ligase